MRRLLLLSAVLLAAAVPVAADPCKTVCEGLPGTYCYYDPAQINSQCVDSGGFCYYVPCLASGAAQDAEMVTSKWKIARVEIDRGAITITAEPEVRVATNETKSSGKPVRE